MIKLYVLDCLNFIILRCSRLTAHNSAHCSKHEIYMWLQCCSHRGLDTACHLSRFSSRFNPTIRGGVKAPLNKNHVFGTFVWSKWPENIWLFPNIYDNASHTLSGSQNGLKRGFYSIFVISRPKIWIQKFGFSAFLGLKWTQLVSKTQN